MGLSVFSGFAFIIDTLMGAVNRMDRQNAVEAALISIKIVYIHNPPSALQ